ncbi:large ribosomal subunit protein uL16m [Aulostomus maculatus]
MLSFIRRAVGRLPGAFGVHAQQPGPLHAHMKVLTAGIRILETPPDHSDVVIPKKTKLKPYQKVPNLVKAKKEMKRLREIRGSRKEPPKFTKGQFAIMAMGGGYLHWGHTEMMRMTIIRNFDSQSSFAIWRIRPPYKPITSKSVGHRMGGGKGGIDHYVIPVRCGNFILELGGKVELKEIEKALTKIVKKLPFPAKVVSRDSLAAMIQEHVNLEQSNQNPWTFKQIVQGNMLGIRKVLSPFDCTLHGRYSGKFYFPDRV